MSPKPWERLEKYVNINKDEEGKEEEEEEEYEEEEESPDASEAEEEEGKRVNDDNVKEEPRPALP